MSEVQQQIIVLVRRREKTVQCEGKFGYERRERKKIHCVKLNRFILVWISINSKIHSEKQVKGYENRVVSEFCEDLEKLATKTVVQIMQKRNYFSHGRHILFFFFLLSFRRLSFYCLQQMTYLLRFVFRFFFSKSSGKLNFIDFHVKSWQ